MHTILPQSCEQALLERFLKAEAMALWAVQSAQVQEIHDVPPHVLPFLRRQEEEEAEHLKEFERRLGVPPKQRDRLPRVPRQWSALAVQLLGYEALGLEFAKLLAQVQPDLGSILKDELIHVAFFEKEVAQLLLSGGSQAEGARQSARAWWRRLPRTLDRYLEGATLTTYRADLRRAILMAIEERFTSIGLLETMKVPARV
jgi:hypothetical protein